MSFQSVYEMQIDSAEFIFEAVQDLHRYVLEVQQEELVPRKRTRTFTKLPRTAKIRFEENLAIFNQMRRCSELLFTPLSFTKLLWEMPSNTMKLVRKIPAFHSDRFLSRTNCALIIPYQPNPNQSEPSTGNWTC